MRIACTGIDAALMSEEPGLESAGCRCPNHGREEQSDECSGHSLLWSWGTGHTIFSACFEKLEIVCFLTIEARVGGMPLIGS